MGGASKLLDVLACPCCKAALGRSEGNLACAACGRGFRVEKGVPVLLPGEQGLEVLHERDLTVWDGYTSAVDDMIASLAADQVVLDIGAGNRRLTDPRVIRMDVVWTPFVDVIGDAHALPFRDDSLDFVLASAVWEHLRNPFEAAREVHRVLKPGGQVGVDCNFVFPFHGYPAVYFNASREGMRQLFAQFREVAVEVAPWQMPSYAVEAVLGEYLRNFRPRTELEREFATALQDLARFPLREFDALFAQDAAARVAAGVSYMGLKQPHGDEHVLPPPVMELYRRDPELRARYPRPAVLLASLLTAENDTLLRWARTEGAARHREIAEWFETRAPFTR
jgi:uncharacterized protein YbaR (Trm112 family)